MSFNFVPYQNQVMLPAALPVAPVSAYVQAETSSTFHPVNNRFFDPDVVTDEFTSGSNTKYTQRFSYEGDNLLTPMFNVHTDSHTDFDTSVGVERSGSVASSIHQCSEEWVSLSPQSGSPNDQLQPNEDFNIDEFDVDLDEKLSLDELIMTTQTESIEQHNVPPIRIRNQPLVPCSVPEQRGNIIIFVDPGKQLNRFETSCLSQTTARKRKRKMSHSNVKVDVSGDDYLESGFLEPANCIKKDDSYGFLMSSENESKSKKSSSIYSSDWDSLFDVNESELNFTSPVSMSSKVQRLEPEKQQRKRALNREAAFRYRKKQKGQSVVEEETYRHAYSTMKQAEKVFTSKRNSLSVLQNVVLDLLQQNQ